MGFEVGPELLGNLVSDHEKNSMQRVYNPVGENWQELVTATQISK